MNIELIVFDIAGTTLMDNGEIAESFQKALHEFGYTVPVVKINPLMGYKKPEAILKILEEFEHDIELIDENYVNKIHKRFQSIMVEYYRNTKELKALPYAEEIFKYLHSKGIKIGLDTGFSKEITDVIIDRLEWLKNGKIDSYVCSDEVIMGRPHPYMINKIMNVLGVIDPNKVIKVGDTEVDVNEGFNAGCKYSIGITSGAFSEEELKKHLPSFIIHHLSELVPIIHDSLTNE